MHIPMLSLFDSRDPLTCQGIRGSECQATPIRFSGDPIWVPSNKKKNPYIFSVFDGGVLLTTPSRLFLGTWYQSDSFFFPQSL